DACACRKPRDSRRVANKIAARRNHVSYRGEPKVRYSGESIPEAKWICPPEVGNSRISPSGAGLFSATKRLPVPSKAKPCGLVRPVAKVLSVPLGENSRIVSFPGSPWVDT